MSELSPLTADRPGESGALEAGIPAGVLSTWQGGASAGDAPCVITTSGAVSFTGGTATGRNIMKNAGLEEVLMELAVNHRC